MRTTLDIDDDVLAVARSRAEREHSSIGRVLSALARDALQSTATGAAPAARNAPPAADYRRQPAGDARTGQSVARRAALMAYLLDVNVLIALLDPAHVRHGTAHAWFERTGQAAWATCPLTENGVLRLVGHPKYPNTRGVPAVVASLVAQPRAHPGHTFWPDNVSMPDPQQVDPRRLLSVAQLTDTCLLARARLHDGKQASFDRRLVTDAVPNGARYLALIA